MAVPDSLRTFIDRKDPSEWYVQVVNPTQPEPIERMLKNVFGGIEIEMKQTDLEGLDDDLLLVIRNGEVVASSSIEILLDTLLLVNSDLYSTGAKSLEEVEIPDVIQELSDTVFTLRGYPHSNTEKLVLTLVSRHIEHLAARFQNGTLRTSFQWLSRLNDEQGTREVYEELGQKPHLNTHVYGTPDWTPPSTFGPIVHEVTDEEIRNHWFVVYSTEAGQDRALVASLVGSNTWQGYWTTNADEIKEINQYIRRTF